MVTMNLRVKGPNSERASKGDPKPAENLRGFHDNFGSEGHVWKNEETLALIRCGHFSNVYLNLSKNFCQIFYYVVLDFC